MTLTQRLSIKTSEQRARLGEIGALDELTPELRTELDTLSAAHTDTEAQLRAAIAADGDANQAADPTVDPEVRERLELRGRASFGRYLAAMLTGQQISGAEAEYQAACKVPGIPIDLFEQDRPEVRADTASGLPATGAGATLAPIQPYVFAESIAPMLGIEMPSVGSGAYSEMTISTALTAAAKAKGIAQESTAAVLSATVAKPRSIRSRLTMNLEDIAEIGVANFESALRQNAGAALSDVRPGRRGDRHGPDRGIARLESHGPEPQSGAPSCRGRDADHALKIARDHNLEGVVRTSNSSPAALDKLTAQAGGTVRVVAMTRAEACRRIRAIADFAFLRAVLSADSCASHDALSHATAKGGSAIGSPARGWPGGTVSVSAAHSASAPTGSVSSTAATTEGAKPS